MSNPIPSVMEKLTKLTPSTSDAIEELVQAITSAIESFTGEAATLQILQAAVEMLEEPIEDQLCRVDPRYLLAANAAEAAEECSEDELEAHASQLRRSEHDDAEAELFQRRPRG